MTAVREIDGFEHYRQGEPQPSIDAVLGEKVSELENGLGSLVSLNITEDRDMIEGFRGSFAKGTLRPALRTRIVRAVAVFRS